MSYELYRKVLLVLEALSGLARSLPQSTVGMNLGLKLVNIALAKN
jgi:hypothetical protein